MPLQFSKYHGAGNDFVVVDGRRLEGERVDWAALARAMCDRHFGVGADGLLIASQPDAPGAAQRMRMYNPDGSEAEMCGNGLRCFVRWLHDGGEVATGRAVPVQTGAGVLTVEIGEGGEIVVEMGAPRLTPAEIPLSTDVIGALPHSGPVVDLAVPLDGHDAARVTCVSMGNPHAVQFISDVDAFPLAEIGPRVERHPVFPQRTNFEVCQVIGRNRVRVRVWERGAGLTLACGTGACAAAVAARLHGYVDDRVTVELPGGVLVVEWPVTEINRAVHERAGVRLSGPVAHVFDGAWPAPVTFIGPGERS